MESLSSSHPGVQSIDCSASAEYYLILCGGLSKPTKCHKKQNSGAATICQIPDCCVNHSSSGIRSQVGPAAVLALLGSVYVTRFVYPCEETLFSGGNSTLRHNSYLRGKEVRVAFGFSSDLLPSQLLNSTLPESYAVRSLQIKCAAMVVYMQACMCSKDVLTVRLCLERKLWRDLWHENLF
jgi:hypothetical protein